MSSYVFILNQNQPTVPTGPTPAQVVVAGAPTRGQVTVSINGPNAIGARASLWVQTATAPYGFTQTVPLRSFYFRPGSPHSQLHEVVLGDLQYSQFLFGQVDQIDGSGLTSVSMSMIV